MEVVVPWKRDNWLASKPCVSEYRCGRCFVFGFVFGLATIHTHTHSQRSQFGATARRLRENRENYEVYLLHRMWRTHPSLWRSATWMRPGVSARCAVKRHGVPEKDDPRTRRKAFNWKAPFNVAFEWRLNAADAGRVCTWDARLLLMFCADAMSWTCYALIPKQ